MRTQEELEKILAEILGELKALGAEPTGEIKGISWTHQRRSWGTCNQIVSKKEFRIEISEALRDETVSEESLKNVVAHECIHTLKGCWNHGRTFKMWCYRMNNKYGHNIATRDSCESLGVDAAQKYADAKYKFVCQKCGSEVGFYRMCTFVKYPEFYTCHKCGGDFKRVEAFPVRTVAENVSRAVITGKREIVVFGEQISLFEED